MKTNDQNPANRNQQENTVRQQQVNQPPMDKKKSGKKPVYIKDMPPIDGAKPGVI
jgi:hypothetical protein